MVFRMKNFNILGVHWKIQFLRGVTKHLYRKGEIAQKRGTGLRGGLGKGHGGCFWQGGGGLRPPIHTMWIQIPILWWIMLNKNVDWYDRNIFLKKLETALRCSL